MKASEREELLRRFFQLHPVPWDAEVDCAEAALFVEQEFGVKLHDSQINADALGSPERIQALVSKASADVEA